MSMPVIFMLMVFVTVFLLTYSLIIPAFGNERLGKKRLRERLAQVNTSFETGAIPPSLLRSQSQEHLSDFEKSLDNSSNLKWLVELISQAGKNYSAYRFLLACTGIGVLTAIIVWFYTLMSGAALIGAVIGFYAPIQKLIIDRNKTMELFEEQLPEALDMIARAMRAGVPFNDALKLVSEEMLDPIAKEFDMTFAEINYGGDVRSAMLGLLERVPSMNVMVLVTSVLIQRETGGNLSEVLGNLSALIRSRFKFQRKVKSLSAEGRMSAWVLSLIPFVLTAFLVVNNPGYIGLLSESVRGQEMIMMAFVLLIIGIFWMKKIIRIEV